jgi:hypothetical protein
MAGAFDRKNPMTRKRRMAQSVSAAVSTSRGNAGQRDGGSEIERSGASEAGSGAELKIG